MTQEEFDKAPLLDQILYDTTGMLVENHPSVAEAMDKYAKVDFLAGYKEAMRWRDPIEEKPNEGVDVMVKAERKEQYSGQELKQIIYMTSCVSKRDGKFIHEGYTKGGYGADIYIKILGWRSLEMEEQL